VTPSARIADTWSAPKCTLTRFSLRASGTLNVEPVGFDTRMADAIATKAKIEKRNILCVLIFALNVDTVDAKQACAQEDVAGRCDRHVGRRRVDSRSQGR
jgi:hypothetical protein